MEATQLSSAGVIWRAVLRRWPAVVLIALMALAASLASVVGRGTTYQATAQFLIVPLSQDDQIFFGTGMLRDSGDPSLTAASAAGVLHSDDIARATAVSLGHGVTPSSVLDHVLVRTSPETNVLQVSATAGSPSDAGRLATAYVDAVRTVRWRLVSTDVSARIAILTARGPTAGDARVAALQETLAAGADPTVQLAQAPSPSVVVPRTSALVVVILALLGGLFLGVLAAVGIDRLTGRVRDSEDARRDSRLLVWAAVPAVPSGLRRIGPVAPSRLPAAAAEKFRELAVHIGQSCQSRGTVAVISSSDGDGRTTTAVNLSSELARQGRSVALVLLDPALDDTARADLVTAGVTVVGGNAGPVATTVEQARALADLVVVDGPPLDRGADLVASLVPAEFVLVVRADHTLRQAHARCLGVLAEIGVQPAGLVLLGPSRSIARRSRRQLRPAPIGPPAASAEPNHLVDPPVRA